MKTVNLNDWVQSGGGVRGISYFHKEDPTLMLKFDNLLTDPSCIERELRAASIAYSIGINTPEPGEVVTDGKRFGLTFRRLEGKVSYARAIGEDPSRAEELMAEFARQTLVLHSTAADLKRMSSIKILYADAIRRNTFHDPAVIGRALDLMDTMPEGDRCLHGDLHFGNILLSSGKSYFIDMGDFSYGYPLFDLAMMRTICQLAAVMPGFFKSTFHCEPDTADRLWTLFAKGYFGPDTDMRRIDENLAPYVALRKLAMEAQAGIPIPEQGLSEVIGLLG